MVNLILCKWYFLCFDMNITNACSTSKLKALRSILYISNVGTSYTLRRVCVSDT
jgi:hypothetical protein